MRLNFDRPPGSPASPRILLVRLSAIGDAVHALHGLAALRAARPAAYLGWLVEDKAASLVERHPDLDRVHVYPRRRWREQVRLDPIGVAREAGRFLAGLRGERYDVAVDLQGNLKSGILASLAGIRRRIGLARGCDKEGSHLFTTEHIAVPREGFHRVDRVLALLAPLGVIEGGGDRRIPVPPADREEVDSFLTGAGLSDGNYAVLHPGTSRKGIAKRWPSERYGALARLLLEEFGLPSVVTWGPGEEDLAGEVVRAGQGAAILAPPLRRLSALGEMARRAGLFVAADTGALHLSAFLGTPTVGLYGPKEPAVYSPRGPRTAVVWKGPGTPMTALDPEYVLQVVREILGPRSPTSGAKKGTEWPDRNPERSEARPAAGRCN